MTSIFFNLLANSSFSLFCGFALVTFFIWFFRVQTGPWKLALLLFPFIKILYDVMVGFPSNSILFTAVDPFSLPPHSQLLHIGGGINWWGPQLDLIFSVRGQNGEKLAASVGDYMLIWLHRNFGGSVPSLIVLLLLSISTFLVCRRIFLAIRFELFRRSDRRRSKPYRTERLFLRSVDIYRSSGFEGTPFTGGLFRPYVCLPNDAIQRLNSDEVECVIAHELAHVRQFDILGAIFVQVLGDIFWFIPGYRALSRRIDRLREMVADQWAVKSGIKPELLAMTLLKLRDIPESSKNFILYSAFFRQKPLLRIRVESLLGQLQEHPPRFGWNLIWFRSAASIWIFFGIMLARLGGNHISNANFGTFDLVLRILGFR